MVEVKDWENNNALDVVVFFTVTGGTITHINGVSASGTTGSGLTDENGNATVTVTRDTAGMVTVTAAVYPSCATEAETKSINILFGGAAIVFCIDCTGSMNGGLYAAAGICDTVDYLGTCLGSGCLLVGGIKFNDYDYTSHTYQLTSNLAAFKTWVSQQWGQGGIELQLEALQSAANMAPGGYIALATDEDWDSTLDPDDVRDELEASGCAVYIDPRYQYDGSVNLIELYGPLAVNGGSVEGASIGTFTFQHLRQDICPQ